jgi:hypothetical protein
VPREDQSRKVVFQKFSKFQNSRLIEVKLENLRNPETQECIEGITGARFERAIQTGRGLPELCALPENSINLKLACPYHRV